MCTAIQRSDNLTYWSSTSTLFELGSLMFVAVLHTLTSLTGSWASRRFSLFPPSILPWVLGSTLDSTAISICMGSEDLNSGHQANQNRKYNFLFCIILLSMVTVQIQRTLLKAEGVWMTTKCLPQQKISSDLMAFHQVERRGNTKSSVRENKDAIYHNNHWESYHLPTKASVTTNTSEILSTIRVHGT